jgi:hypothetical protein
MPKVWKRGDPNIPAGAVYIGRPSTWGNPYSIGRGRSRAEVIAAYREWLFTCNLIGDVIRELKGKDLICHCAPKPCHGDVLLEIANG